MVVSAFKKVKRNGGGAGIDNINLTTYESNLSNNLYKLWNRLSSGSYFPPAVKACEIAKSDGKKRTYNPFSTQSLTRSCFWL